MHAVPMEIVDAGYGQILLLFAYSKINSTGVIWTSIWDLFLEDFLHDDNVRRSYSYNYTIQQISKLHLLPP